MRERVHQLHHVRGERALPPGEEEDHQRRGHPVRHVHAGLRHVRGAAEALPAEVQRGQRQFMLDVTSCFLCLISRPGNRFDYFQITPCLSGVFFPGNEGGKGDARRVGG